MGYLCLHARCLQEEVRISGADADFGDASNVQSSDAAHQEDHRLVELPSARRRPSTALRADSPPPAGRRAARTCQATPTHLPRRPIAAQAPPAAAAGSPPPAVSAPVRLRAPGPDLPPAGSGRRRRRRSAAAPVAQSQRDTSGSQFHFRFRRPDVQLHVRRPAARADRSGENRRGANLAANRPPACTAGRSTSGFANVPRGAPQRPLRTTPCYGVPAARQRARRSAGRGCHAAGRLGWPRCALSDSKFPLLAPASAHDRRDGARRAETPAAAVGSPRGAGRRPVVVQLAVIIRVNGAYSKRVPRTLIVHSELKSVHPGFPVASIFLAQVN